MKEQLSEQLRINDKRRLAIRPDGTEIPVQDAKYDFLVQPNEEDRKNGVPQDPSRCMYCLSCQRQFGSQAVHVTKTRAYVELKVKGKSVLLRFILRGVARENVEKFDAVEPVTLDAVVFCAPKGHEKLDPPKSKRKLVAKGTIIGPAKKKDGRHGKRTDSALPFAIESRKPASGLLQFHRG